MPELVLFWWRGQDLNLRPSGYETTSERFLRTWWKALHLVRAHFVLTAVPLCLPLFTVVLYMDGTYSPLDNQAGDGFSSACWATVTPSALAISHRRARLVER